MFPEKGFASVNEALKRSRNRKSYRTQKITSAITDLKVTRKILRRCYFVESSVNKCFVLVHQLLYLWRLAIVN